MKFRLISHSKRFKNSPSVKPIVTLSVLLDNLAEAIYVINHNWEFIYLNTQAKKYMQRPGEQLLGKNLWEEFPATETRLLPLYEQALKEKIRLSLELPPVYSKLWYELNLYPIKEGLLVHFRDISKRKLMEQQLQESEYRYRVLSEATFEGVVVHRAGIALEANQSAAHLYGYNNPKELIGQSITQHLTEESLASLQKWITEGSEGALEVEVIRKDGSRFPAETRGKTMYYHGESVRVITGRDITKVKEAEAELRFHSYLLDVVEQSVIATNLNGIVTYWNNYAETLYGWSRAETLGHKLGNFIVPEISKAQADALMQRITKGESWSGEFLTNRKDGSVFLVQVTNTPFTDKEGKLAGVLGISFDISERKRTEEALRQTEERYRTLFNANPQPQWLVDLETLRFLVVNNAAIELYGYSYEEFLSKSLADIRLPEALEQLKNYLANLSKGTGGSFVATKHRKKDGSLIDVECRWSFIEFEGKQTGLAFVTDVTQRRRTEQALILSEARREDIITSANDAIITLDAGQSIVLFNRAAEQMFGYSTNLILGQSIDSLIPPRFRQLHKQHIQNFGNTGVSTRSMISPLSTLKGLRANGEEFPIEATISQIKTEGQKFFTVIIRDMSEQVKAEQELRQKEEQLRQALKMEAVGRLAGGIAHDFNNILTAILGYYSLLAKSLHSADPLYDYVGEIGLAAQRAAELTKQLLAFSRQQVLDLKVINLNTVVTKLNKMMERVLGEDIEISLNLAARLSNILADVGQIEQILLNLAVNSRDAMPNGGKLSIETANVNLDEAYSLTHQEVKAGEYVVLTVLDNGQGMSEETSTQIFEPFFTTKEQGKGTGLGLSTVYGIVKQSQGHIWVYSEIGLGTTFKLYFPVIDQMATQAPQITSPKKQLGGTETIFLVEDDKSVRMLISKYLQQNGYTVLTATNGQEAFTMLKANSERIKLLISDMVMPKMGGGELIKNLKAIKPDLKILGMSGYSENIVSERGLLDYCSGFMQKPFGSEELLQKVRELLDAE